MADQIGKSCIANRTLFWTVWRCFVLAIVICAGFSLPLAAGAEPKGDGGQFLDQFGLKNLSLETLARSLELKTHEVLLAEITKSAAPPVDFTTDGCSGGLSATWQQVAGYWPGFAARYRKTPPFEACCVIHDRAYHAISGAQSAVASYSARLDADQKLRQCVARYGRDDTEQLAAAYGVSQEVLRAALEHLSQAMYYAVRFGGGPCSGLSWRWGYGYPSC